MSKKYKISVITFFSIIILFGFFSKFLDYTSRLRKEREATMLKIEDTKKVFREIFSTLSTDGKFSREESEFSDAWENLISISYVEGNISDTLVLTSAGPDGLFNTKDDLKETYVSMNTAVVTENIKEKTINTTKSLFEKFWSK